MPHVSATLNCAAARSQTRKDALQAQIHGYDLLLKLNMQLDVLLTFIFGRKIDLECKQKCT